MAMEQHFPVLDLGGQSSGPSTSAARNAQQLAFTAEPLVCAEKCYNRTTILRRVALAPKAFRAECVSQITNIMKAIPKTMMAAVVEKFRQPLQIREVPVPSPGPGQALVQIVATGVCHTDLHAADGDWPIKPNPPFVPGHEGAGVVVALGSGVTHLKEGDRVGIAWLHSACGHCEFCLSGWETLCHAQQNSGYSVNGSFAEYALGEADFLSRIPDQLSFVDAGPILCAGVTTYKGLKETEAFS